MKTPADITFLHMDPSEAVADRVRAEIEALEQRYDRIHSCRVVIEAPHRHRQHGREVHVKIDLGVPGSHLVVNHEPSLHGAQAQSTSSSSIRGGGESQKHLEPQPDHKDVYVSIRDAFNAARRLLEEHIRTLRGEHSAHAAVEAEAV